MVTSIPLCPAICWTMCGGTPRSNSNVTQECRRSWNRMSGPSRSRSGYPLRRRLSGSSGVPTRDVKTSPCSVQPSNRPRPPPSPAPAGPCALRAPSPPEPAATPYGGMSASSAVPAATRRPRAEANVPQQARRAPGRWPPRAAPATHRTAPRRNREHVERVEPVVCGHLQQQTYVRGLHGRVPDGRRTPRACSVMSRNRPAATLLLRCG